ncbi:unnamed protein product [Gadus morhua 'NCC']
MMPLSPISELQTWAQGWLGSCAPQTLLSQQLAVSWRFGHLAPLDGQTRQLSPGPQRTAMLHVSTTDTLTAGEKEVVVATE